MCLLNLFNISIVYVFNFFFYALDCLVSLEKGDR